MRKLLGVLLIIVSILGILFGCLLFVSEISLIARRGDQYWVRIFIFIATVFMISIMLYEAGFRLIKHKLNEEMEIRAYDARYDHSVFKNEDIYNSIVANMKSTQTKEVYTFQCTGSVMFSQFIKDCVIWGIVICDVFFAFPGYIIVTSKAIFMSLTLITMVLILAIKIFFFCNLRIELTSEGLTFYHGEKQYDFVKLEDDLYTHTTRYYVNFMLIGVKKVLINRSGKKEKTYSCIGMSKTDYKDMINKINELRQNKYLSSIS